MRSSSPVFQQGAIVLATSSGRAYGEVEFYPETNRTMEAGERGRADLDVLLDMRLCLVLSRICFRGWDVYPPLGHEIAGVCGHVDGSRKTM